MDSEHDGRRRVIAFAELTPANCSHILSAGEDAVAILDKWQLPTGNQTRLRQAIAHLKRVVRKDSFGESPEELLRTAKALTLVTDFFQIASCLQEERSENLAQELSIALDGHLLGRGTSRSPYEMHSQFWCGMTLAHAGLRPGVPPIGSTKRPDFVIQTESLSVGVEVKRPSKFRSAVRALDTAASQLREYGHPGIIIADVTDCLFRDEQFPDVFLPGAHVGDAVDKIFSYHAERLSTRPSTYKQSDKYKRILLLVVVARVFWWALRQDGHLRPQSSVFVSVHRYPDACMGLIREQSFRIRQHILSGFEESAGRAGRSIG